MSNASKTATGASDHVATSASGHGPWTRPVETVVQSLQVRLGVGVDPARIRTEVEAEFATYAAARVRQFVPILVERRVHASLSDQLGP